MHTEPHYETSLQKDLELLRVKVQQMANLGEAALRKVMQALQNNDRQTAYMVILRDQIIDDMEDEIDRICLQFIVRHQPVAGHLRFVYSVLKMVSWLERIGDYAESMARQAILLHDHPVDLDDFKLAKLADISIPMFHDAIQAFLNRDVERALSLIGLEDVADQHRFQINQHILELGTKGEIPQEALNPLLTIARRLERVADQAKAICQETQYVVTGENIKHSGGCGYDVLFVDEDNSLVSQMAEGIGAGFGNPMFRFKSAGITQGTISPMTLGFLGEKSIDISSQKPKTVMDVLSGHNFHLIILLASGISAKIKTPTSTIVLEWPVKMPKFDVEDPAAMFPAYEKVFDYLYAHIKDLVMAMSERNN